MAKISVEVEVPASHDRQQRDESGGPKCAPRSPMASRCDSGEQDADSSADPTSLVHCADLRLLRATWSENTKLRLTG